MKTETGTIELKEIKANPANPRVISSKKLSQLKYSILEFSSMLEISPVVIDENNMIIGGNMRYKALTELNYKQVPYVRVIGLTPEQKQQFIIKDNVNYGDWDWNVLLDGFTAPELEGFGLEVPEDLLANNTERQVDPVTLKDRFDTWMNNDIRSIKIFLSPREEVNVKSMVTSLMINNKLETNGQLLTWLLDEYFKDNDLIDDRR